MYIYIERERDIYALSMHFYGRNLSYGAPHLWANCAFLQPYPVICGSASMRHLCISSAIPVYIYIYIFIYIYI